MVLQAQERQYWYYYITTECVLPTLVNHINQLPPVPKAVDSGRYHVLPPPEEYSVQDFVVSFLK